MKVQYPAEKSVSIWVGVFDNEEQMDRRIDKEIEPSLELSVPLSAICEVAFESEPLPLRQLLQGFSGWQTFAEQACQAGTDLKVEEANGALVCYHLRCSAPTALWQGMTYLGKL